MIYKVGIRWLSSRASQNTLFLISHMEEFHLSSSINMIGHDRFASEFDELCHSTGPAANSAVLLGTSRRIDRLSTVLDGARSRYPRQPSSPYPRYCTSLSSARRIWLTLSFVCLCEIVRYHRICSTRCAERIQSPAAPFRLLKCIWHP